MKLLLDSHVLLWLGVDDPVLARDARAAILDERNDAIVSVASVWELEIKRAKGLLQIPPDAGTRLNPAGFDVLDVKVDHVVRAAELPPLHRDPFDRLLVAQAQATGATLVTADAAITAYDVPVMPARA